MATKSSKISPTERLWRLLKPDKREITNIYIYSIFNGLVGLSLPLAFKQL